MLNYINSRSYKYIFKGELKYISFVSDIKNRIYYVLKGENSLIWDDILNSSDIENNIEDKLKSISFFSISFSDKNFEAFYKFLLTFYYKYGFIRTLTLEHCYQDSELINYQISYETAKKIIDDAYPSGIRTVSLSGGECTINPDFLKISNYIKKLHLSLIFLTNGQYLFDNTSLYEDLIKLYPSAVQLTLFSINPQIHDTITGVKGSHYKTLSVIKKLKEDNIIVKIACPILSYNVKDYGDVYKFAQANDIECTLNSSFINNPLNNNYDAKLSCKNIEKHYSEYFNIIKRDEFIKNDEFICGGGIMSLNIKPNLDVTPCSSCNYKLGNLNEISFNELKQVILPEYKKKYIRSNLSECFNHDYCRFCDYCSAYPTHDSGFMKKSQILCDDAKAYYKAYLEHQKNNIKVNN